MAETHGLLAYVVLLCTVQDGKTVDALEGDATSSHRRGSGGGGGGGGGLGQGDSHPTDLLRNLVEGRGWSGLTLLLLSGKIEEALRCIYLLTPSAAHETRGSRSASVLGGGGGAGGGTAAAPPPPYVRGAQPVMLPAGTIEPSHRGGGGGAVAVTNTLTSVASAGYVQTEHLYNIQCSEIFTLRNENLHTEA